MSEQIVNCMTTEMREAAHEAARQHQLRAERAVRQLLGRWVSELEPTIAYDQEYRVIGISYGGQIVMGAAE